MATLDLPTITQEDLSHFRTQHGLGVPSNEFHTSHHLGDESLGHYADGTERTLTDEEIAIFRHSEIQKLLQVMRKKAEADEEEHSPEIDTIIATGEVQHSLRTAGDPTLTTSGRKRKASQQRINQQKSRQSWSSFVDDSETNPRSFTHRRLAREMDDQPSSTTELDY